MRSYFYWVDAVLQGVAPVDALYHKVIYKMTTDEEEIALLEQALKQQNQISALEELRVFRNPIQTEKNWSCVQMAVPRRNRLN